MRRCDSAPAGSPAATAAASYYKIAADNAITFGWKYTSL